MVWLGVALNVVVIVVKGFWPYTTLPEEPAWIEIVYPNPVATEQKINPFMVAGALCTVFAAVLRVW